MIIIVDFGSQLAHLIAKKVRMLGEYTEIVPPDQVMNLISESRPKGIIFSGGPESVYNPTAPSVPQTLFDQNIPILGICYGYQLLAHLTGGKVEKGEKSEYGVTTMTKLTDHPLLEGLEDQEKVLMSHRDRVITPPPNSQFVATTEKATAAYADDARAIYGIQFHPEVTHTPKGMQLLVNFLKLCKCERSWSSHVFLESKMAELRSLEQPILMAVSGGVDSTVAATMLAKAVPDLLHCVFVDNGLLRLGEADRVRKIYEELFTHFHFVDASQEFFACLEGLIDPEEKRKAIGHKFIEVFERTAKELEERFGKFAYLGQGTIYPDRVESAVTSTNSAVIKSHHNVGGLPEKMNLRLVEPLTDLYKYEVREVGEELELPPSLIRRHPFPGPGLAVRCLGEVTPFHIQQIQKADAILQENLRMDERVDYDALWQSFFVLLPTVRSVGVMGDSRTYENPGVIRVVESTDAMTASVADLPFDLLTKIANEIVNHVPGINRVCLDLTGKPPGTIEWE